ncbi:MAG: hypothetical protein MEP57_08570 [Microvirga sp.]|nr:hypothetical protein [Microvirga sp.]
MPKTHRFHVEIDDSADFARRTQRSPGPKPALTARELRSLYLMREAHVEDIVSAACNLDEGQRRLALRLIEAMSEHKRAMLS